MSLEPEINEEQIRAVLDDIKKYMDGSGYSNKFVGEYSQETRDRYFLLTAGSILRTLNDAYLTGGISRLDNLKIQWSEDGSTLDVSYDIYPSDYIDMQLNLEWNDED